ncbi:MAG: hypothetical protein HFE83_02470 [Lachnospiraceae bacterium]|nr:hypothetical protein [Lachnospiraceae bacterium]
MEKIRNYVDRFFSKNKRNLRYSMTCKECADAIEELYNADVNQFFYTISTLFNYGYAKGYKACQAEQKKLQGV